MESIKLGTGKILVILTGEEVAALSAGGGAENVAAVLLPGLVAAGFAAWDGSLLFEMFGAKDGGCELFITAEPQTAEESGARCDMEYIKSGGNVDPSYFRTEEKQSRVTYRFDALDGLICACRELSLSYKGDSSLSESGGEFVLSLADDSPLPGEFGGIRLAQTEALAASEHGRSVTDDAVFRLAALI